MILPWRPEHGKVVRMFCSITYPDGKLFECDTRSILKRAVKDAEEAGLSFSFGSEQEFYLFKLDDNGERTNIPYDNAGYMDIAPDDKEKISAVKYALHLNRWEYVLKVLITKKVRDKMK